MNLDDLAQVSNILESRYENWAHHNKKDPLDELLFIVCSTKTNEASYLKTYSALKSEFPTRMSLAEAPAEYIAKPLEGGGLQGQKSRMIKEIMDKIIGRFGKPTLAPLKKMTDEECEAFLTSLPGVGKKVARCVMMYALDRKVFPVDAHCWRICVRLGWVRRTQKDGHCAPRDMDRLQDKIPPELRYGLHVNMLSLGREFCLAQRPRCGECPIAGYCKRVGVKPSNKTYRKCSTM